MPVESCCGGGALSYVLAPLPLKEPLHGKMASASQVATPGQRLGHRLAIPQSISMPQVNSQLPADALDPVQPLY